MEKIKGCYCMGDQKECGKCYICGEKGHLRPSLLYPATLGYCDKHYKEEKQEITKIKSVKEDMY